MHRPIGVQCNGSTDRDHKLTITDGPFSSLVSRLLSIRRYIVGSKTAHLANNWRWALRVTPILGVIAVVLILLIKDPPRGHSEGSENLEPTTYKEDICELLRNRSFMLSTAGFTCVAFVAGALAWWGPSFIYLGMKMQPGNEDIVQDK